MTWSPAVPLARLRDEGKTVAKIGGKQIALFLTADGVRACNNRCPHEGFPLREGTLEASGESCVLTCNWHNWKFDLASGTALVGRDPVRTYPVECRDGAVPVSYTHLTLPTKRIV